MSRIVLVTGASSGIGRLAAERFAREGAKVYAASRRARAPQGCTGLAMDVDRDEAVSGAIGSVLAAEGRIDAVVHCAGWGLAGAIEDCSPAEAQAQFETNFFGAHRVVRAALPALRESKGTIVLVSSLAAGVPLPYQAFYSASKAALTSYAEALRLELHPFGVRVACIAPGNFRTDFTGSRRRAAGWTAASVHASRSEESVKWMEQDEVRAPPPDAVVAAIVRAVADADPKLHQVVVAQVFERIGAALRQLLPQRLYLAIARKVFRVS
ncbi:MAG TPA: SDR family NAD(P)-dependent oxidoreductase [Solimonas sp.]|nr:SDR family NAD(P)-dependent oxidoreductase [Solimonas sp.]